MRNLVFVAVVSPPPSLGPAAVRLRHGRDQLVADARCRGRGRPRTGLDPHRAARASRATRRPAGRRCSTSGSAPTAGGSATSSGDASCRRRSRSSSTRQAYRVFLRDRPALVRFLVATCGNVYDDRPSNVFDADYEQPDTDLNHYQDISVRRVVAELVDDPGWPDVAADAARDGRPRRRGNRPRPPGAARVGVPWIAAAPDPRPAVARLRAQPGGRPRPRPGADHDPPVARRVVPRRGLRPPLGRGVLADEQGHRGALRPLPRAGRRRVGAARGRRAPREPAGDGLALLGPLSLDIYLGRDLVLPGGGALNMAWHWRRDGDVPFELLTRVGDDRPEVFRAFLARHGIAAHAGARRAGRVVVDRHRDPARPPAVHGQLRRGRVGGLPDDARRAGARCARPGACTSSSSRARSASWSGSRGRRVARRRRGHAPTSSASATTRAERFAATMRAVDVGFVGLAGRARRRRRAGDARRRARPPAARRRDVRRRRACWVFDGRPAGEDAFVPVVAVPVAGTTVGCGDAFVAGFLGAWRGQPDVRRAIEAGAVRAPRRPRGAARSPTRPTATRPRRPRPGRRGGQRRCQPMTNETMTRTTPAIAIPAPIWAWRRSTSIATEAPVVRVAARAAAPRLVARDVRVLVLERHVALVRRPRPDACPRRSAPRRRRAAPGSAVPLQPSASRRSRTSWVTRAASAAPAVAFITCPTKNPATGLPGPVVRHGLGVRGDDRVDVLEQRRVVGDRARVRRRRAGRRPACPSARWRSSSSRPTGRETAPSTIAASSAASPPAGRRARGPGVVVAGRLGDPGRGTGDEVRDLLGRHRRVRPREIASNAPRIPGSATRTAAS